jgi:hypothetical protein
VLPSCLCSLMSFSVRGSEVIRNTILTSPEGGMATPSGSRRLVTVRDPRRGPYCRVITDSEH